MLLEDWAVVVVPEAATAGFAGRASDEASADTDAETWACGLWLGRGRASWFAGGFGHF